MRQMLRSAGSRLMVISLGGAMAISAVAFTQRQANNDTVERPDVIVDERPLDRDAVGVTSFAPVVKKVAPAVVMIHTSARVQATQYQGNSQMDDMLRRFFGDRFGDRSPRRFGPAPRQQGIGSGVIVSKDGYILTNNHVVENADEVKVTLLDGREFQAKVTGRDPKSEVAVIKIDAKDLPALPLADSDQIEVGDVVLAVGNPFGIGQTVTSGIISATGRAGTLGLDYEDFIQTDAAINPGNSGGALVDLQGRLIGINTAILSRSGGNLGIGFAIPTNLARDVMDSLVTDGRVTRGFMGVMIQDLTPALAEQFKAEDTKGALVGDVTPRGPAAKAGIQSGDIIVEVDGKQVSDSRQLRLQVSRVKPGKSVPIKLLRNGAPRTVEVTVQQLPGTQELAGSSQTNPVDEGTLNGVVVSDIDTRVRQELKLPANVKGIIVTEVQPDSAAASAGLRSGDVILEINRKTVSNAEEAVAMTEQAEDKRTLLRVWRNGGSRFVIVDETEQG